MLFALPTLLPALSLCRHMHAEFSSDRKNFVRVLLVSTYIIVMLTSGLEPSLSVHMMYDKPHACDCRRVQRLLKLSSL